MWVIKVKEFTNNFLGTADFKVPLEEDPIQLAKRLASKEKDPHGCSNSFLQLALELMRINNLQMPMNTDEAKDLYFRLCDLIDNI